MKYTCQEYRQEMILASLRRRLEDGALGEEEKEMLRQQIETLEKEMGLQ